MNGDNQSANQQSIIAAIENAEEVRDPMEALLERTTADPGAAFTPAALKQLAALRKNDAHAFETLRSELKKAGCRVAELDKAIAKAVGDCSTRATTQADILLELAQAAELFHTPDDIGYADVGINGHRETWPIRSKGFRQWLTRRFFELTRGAPNSEALHSASNVIEAEAHFDGPEQIVHMRVGDLDGRLYMDLGDESWRAVEIDTNGWRVIDRPPVRFRRPSGMQPLPVPITGGSIETLRNFLNVRPGADFVLVVAWMLACLRKHRDYPVLALAGEQGSAKSTFSKVLRALLDPTAVPLRALPREDRDLFIAANNSHLLAFDNVSGLPQWISDTLCRLSTGGGFATRQLFTDLDEILIGASRPVILNGIEQIVSRPDLADRTLFLTLEPISKERRRSEAELWTAFKAERPRILGVLLDALAEGLRRLPTTRLAELPRMADFALWVTACETALWPKGTFWSAFCDNRDEAIEDVIEADPVAEALRAMMESRTQWTGTSSDLLDALTEIVGERIAKSKSWPGSARVLSGRVRRLATFLRAIEINVDFGRGSDRGRKRLMTIASGPAATRPDGGANSPSAPSASSEGRSAPAQDTREFDARTVMDGVDANLPARSGSKKMNSAHREVPT